jgi:predicted metal-dependent peptidase
MMLWNIAADITINFMLLSEGFKLPKEGILPQGHYGEVTVRNKTVYARDQKTGYDHTAERIYEQLLDICNGDGDGEGQGQGQGDEDSYGSGSGTGGIGDLPQGFDQHEYGQDLSPAEEEEIRKEWKGKLVDAATAAKARGCLPGSIARLVEELLNPKLNWKSILYQYITKDLLYNFTNRRPGKRSWSTGLYFPSEIKENLNIAVTVDCSGSISKKEYQDFISEVVGIANAFEQVNMDLLFWDTDVRLVEKISRANKQKVLDMQPEAGGGTHIGCLKDFYVGKQTPQLMIHLTDGWIESEPSLPWCKHMFVLCEKYSSDEIVKKYGIVAKLED